MHKFPFTELYGVVVLGVFCGPVQVGGFSASIQGLHFLVLLPLNYIIICTLLSCNHCTVLEVAPKYAQISIHGSIRRCRTRNTLRARPVRWAFCTNSRFTFFGSPSSYVPYHILPASVQPLYRARRSSKLSTNFHLRTYTALQYAEQFAAPSKPVGFLHQLKVYIFRLSFPIASFLYAPCFGGTVAPC